MRTLLKRTAAYMLVISILLTGSVVMSFAQTIKTTYTAQTFLAPRHEIITDETVTKDVLKFVIRYYNYVHNYSGIFTAETFAMLTDAKNEVVATLNANRQTTEKIKAVYNNFWDSSNKLIMYASRNNLKYLIDSAEKAIQSRGEYLIYADSEIMTINKLIQFSYSVLNSSSSTGEKIFGAMLALVQAMFRTGTAISAQDLRDKQQELCINSAELAHCTDKTLARIKYVSDEATAVLKSPNSSEARIKSIYDKIIYLYNTRVYKTDYKSLQNLLKNAKSDINYYFNIYSEGQIEYIDKMIAHEVNANKVFVSEEKSHRSFLIVYKSVYGIYIPDADLENLAEKINECNDIIQNAACYSENFVGLVKRYVRDAELLMQQSNPSFSDIRTVMYNICYTFDVDVEYAPNRKGLAVLIDFMTDYIEDYVFLFSQAQLNTIKQNIESAKELLSKKNIDSTTLEDTYWNVYHLLYPDVMLGDANLDGKVNLEDVVGIQKSIASIAGAEITGKNLTAADANGDGVISMSDVTLIQRFIAGLVKL